VLHRGRRGINADMGVVPLIEMLYSLACMHAWLCSLWRWRLADCKRFANCLNRCLPSVQSCCTGILGSIPSVTVTWSILFVWSASSCVCKSWRDMCVLRGFVVEASIFLKFSQFHHSGNGQIIGAQILVRTSTQPARMSDSSMKHACLW
jgi:hypothetical protein